MEARDVKRDKEGKFKGDSLVGHEIQSEFPCLLNCFSERCPHIAGSDLRLTCGQLFMSKRSRST